jgi:hypothetical protein
MAQRLNHKKENELLNQKSSGIKVISKTNQRKGLCLDCVRSESCTLSHNIDEVIWNCEDYENEEIGDVQTEQVGSLNQNYEIKATPSAEQNPGLCAHCAYAETCSLKQVDGGVWHCEEYA